MLRGMSDVSISDAIESARTTTKGDELVLIHRAEPQRRHSFEHVRGLVLAVVRELPEGMTIVELREGLEEAEPIT